MESSGSSVGVEGGPNGIGGGFWIVRWDHDPAFLAIWDMNIKSWETLFCSLQKRSWTWKLERVSAWKAPIESKKTIKSNVPILQMWLMCGEKSLAWGWIVIAGCACQYLLHSKDEGISWMTREFLRRYPLFLIQRIKCLYEAGTNHRALAQQAQRKRLGGLREYKSRLLLLF